MNGRTKSFSPPFMVFLQELFVSCFYRQTVCKIPLFLIRPWIKKKDRLSPCFSQQCKRILFYCDVNSFKGLKSQSIFLPRIHCTTAFAAYLCSVSQKINSASEIYWNRVRCRCHLPPVNNFVIWALSKAANRQTSRMPCSPGGTEPSVLGMDATEHN